MAVASAASLLVLSWGGETLAWGSPELLGLGALAITAGAAFAARERRAADVDRDASAS